MKYSKKYSIDRAQLGVKIKCDQRLKPGPVKCAEQMFPRLSPELW